MKIKYFDKNHKKIDLKNIKETLALASIPIAAFATMVTISLYGNSNPIYNGKFDEVMEQTSYVVGEAKYPLDDIYLLFNEKEIRKCTKKEIVAGEYTDAGFDFNNLAFKNLTGYYPITSETKTNYMYNFYDISTNELIATTEYNANSSEDLLREYRDEPIMNGYKYIKLSDIIKEDFKNEKEEDYLNTINNNSIDDLVEEYHSKTK